MSKLKQQASQGFWGSAGVKMSIHVHFWRGILTRNVGQTDLVLACDQGSLVSLRLQDYNIYV